MFCAPKSTPTAEWIEDNFYLPRVSGDVSGLYSFDYAPIFLGVAAALDDPRVREVSLMKAAQHGWSYFLIAYVLKRIKEAGNGKQCPIMILFAKEKDGKAFHDEKLAPSVKENKSLDAVLDVSTSRKSGNRWDYKNFPGGFLKLVGSNSPGNVKSTSSVGVGVVEEPDDTSENVKEQGDSISLIEERLKRYTGSKLIVGGTPAVKGLSRTEYRVNMSDARVLPIACHDCGEKHVLDFENVQWVGKHPDETLSGDAHPVYGLAKPETAIYACPCCGSVWDDYQRKKNIRDTVYNAIADGDKNCGWVATQPFAGRAGFKELNELYSCIPGTTLEELVQEFLEAEHLSALGDQSKKIKFTNQKLGRPYEYKSKGPDLDALELRAEDYEEFTLPAGALVLTAGVDVQHDRLAVTLWAHGRNEEMWLVYWGELSAETNLVNPDDRVWRDLDNVLFTPRLHASGFRVSLSAGSVDCSDGMTAETVYAYVAKRQSRGIMAAKGDSHDYGQREIYSTPKKLDFKSKTKASKWGVLVYMVGTTKVKDMLIGDRGRITLTGSGANRMHWYKGVRSDFYAQLTSEVKAPHRRSPGKLVWQCKSGVRNEALDCTGLSVHAARSIGSHRWSEKRWDDLELRLMQTDLFTPQAMPAPVASAEKTKTKHAGGVSVTSSNSQNAFADIAKKLNG